MERTYTVMLVEDERNILYGMKNAILCYKPQVSDIMTAENGREALELLEERVPDIIITDIRMPEVDGTELVRRIREQGYEMPVIILTAMTDFAIARDLIDQLQKRRLSGSAVAHQKDELLPFNLKAHIVEGFLPRFICLCHSVE